MVNEDAQRLKSVDEMSGLRGGKETNAGGVERECSVAIEIGTEGEGDVFQ